MSSSHEKNRFSASKGRLNGAASWRRDDDNQNQWLQVDLGKNKLVTAIATQGSSNSWVKTFSISYGVDKENLTSYKINATQKVFAGNDDKNSVVTNLLYPTINARYIRIHPVSWFDHISLRIEVIGCYTGSCNTSKVPLGAEDGRIKNSQMSSSTEKNGFSASKGRLNGAASWRPDDDDQNQWLQVDLGKKKLVTAIATQGFGSNRYWVKTYSISYGVDKENLTSYKINATQKVFAGNDDKNSVVTNLLYPTINARYIRIHPVSWFDHISLRIEVIGCYTGSCNTSKVPLGAEDGRIKNSQMSSSTEKNGFSASKGRLNGAASWRPDDDDQNQWLQVDLGKKKLVTAIATQGFGSNRYWVKTYSISYGVDKENLTSYKINATQKVFDGNTDENSVVTNVLSPAVTARYIRIHPKTWNNHISLRVELYGCERVNAIPCKAGEKTLGVEDKNKVKDSQLTSSSYWKNYYAARGRLYNKDIGWIAGVNDQNPWIQVDLGKKEVVSGIATQGGSYYYNKSYRYRWVKTYSVKYSLNETTFESYKDEGDDKVRIIALQGV
ncbi:venom prothrombin activator pseutarin-C non-catalytic subunit-like [Dendronephthya gigantea]|uniref:venom prothrombin activator pseutarin-C non-catalytic subunit-like n=1 Tax=Dendronephthya gigantea TaxID=151771 RepID=UPI00106B7006|nr:venom prothrombin activator pseutarin-C non-catalytic subunit-like [Dendronephthya gigantea]